MSTADTQGGGIARLVENQAENCGRSPVSIAVWLVTRGVIASLDEAYELAKRYIPRPHFTCSDPKRAIEIATWTR